MGKPKGTPNAMRGRRATRKRPTASSRALRELMTLIDGDVRGYEAVLAGKVSHITVSRWRNGVTQSADLRAVETVGAAYGYRLTWERMEHDEERT